MNDKALTFVSSGKAFTVDFVTTHNPTGNFTILLPGKYEVINKNDDSNYLDDEGFTSDRFQSLFKPQTEFPDYGFNLDGLPEDVTTYDSIRKFLPVLVGNEYVRILGCHWFKKLIDLYCPVFIKPEADEDPEFIFEKQTEFKYIIENELPNLLKSINDKYTLLLNCKDKENILRRIEIEKHKIIIKNGYSYDNKPFDFSFNFNIFPNTIDLYKQMEIQKKIDCDIECIMSYLAKLSELSAYFNKDDNVYRKFIGSMIENMGGNYTITNYNRDIINHSVFQWNIDNYPYNTKSGNLYSVNTFSTQNKLYYSQLTVSNIENLSKGLNDLTIVDNKEKTPEDSIKNLKNALSSVCILIGIKSEMKALDLISEGIFLKDIVKPSKLTVSKRYLSDEEKTMF